MAQSKFNLELTLDELQIIDKRLQERDVLLELSREKDKQIDELQKSLALAQKELELEKRENDINKRLLAVKDQEITALNKNFDQMKEVADRALKLAETAKPSSTSNWQLMGLLGLAAFAVGIALGAM